MYLKNVFNQLTLTANKSNQLLVDIDNKLTKIMDDSSGKYDSEEVNEVLNLCMKSVTFVLAYYASIPGTLASDTPAISLTNKKVPPFLEMKPPRNKVDLSKLRFNMEKIEVGGSSLKPTETKTDQVVLDNDDDGYSTSSKTDATRSRNLWVLKTKYRTSLKQMASYYKAHVAFTEYKR